MQMTFKDRLDKLGVSIIDIQDLTEIKELVCTGAVIDVDVIPKTLVEYYRTGSYSPSKKIQFNGPGIGIELYEMPDERLLEIF